MAMDRRGHAKAQKSFPSKRREFWRSIEQRNNCHIIMFFLTLRYFGFSAFRPYQKEVIQAILRGKDCLVVTGTGSGKSLCYQVPPLVVGKTGIVVSPLISLMQDQVMALKQRGIKSEYLGSTQTDSTVQAKAESGQYNILFMTPEKACSLPLSFWSKLKKAGICLFAVDEAHCISEWGHNFRAEYELLDDFRDVLPGLPFVALTATAPEKVRSDIINYLKMKDPQVTIGSFDRTNLFYGVKFFKRPRLFMNELVLDISKYLASGGSTIVYCRTIKAVEQISKSLKEAGISAGIYHAQMDKESRAESHRLFIRDEVQVMVATVAFGMGIDKPNVRQVIHYGCPKSLESYYQESGRCGRDGIASVCWLYYTRSDFAKAELYCGESPTENKRTAIMESLMAAQRTSNKGNTSGKGKDVAADEEEIPSLRTSAAHMMAGEENMVELNDRMNEFQIIVEWIACHLEVALNALPQRQEFDTGNQQREEIWCIAS
ncbi:ATP-dependent DNA helicase RecQ-like [Cucumis melo var. makuwa]|uniref:DNA 3'-5' helicase n=1 Tax=Cucumis melo var. makuwa TaxID=1194695 RepID=A0A5D3DUQ9_CUCMM|nr:ATP-dependent DNA helicase RecQ-like [Cucumis melo var. makuwa]